MEQRHRLRVLLGVALGAGDIVGAGGLLYAVLANNEAREAGPCFLLDVTLLGLARVAVFQAAARRALGGQRFPVRPYAAALTFAAALDTLHAVWLVDRYRQAVDCCGEGTYTMAAAISWHAVVGWFQVLYVARARDRRRRDRKAGAFGGGDGGVHEAWWGGFGKGGLDGYESDESAATFHTAVSMATEGSALLAGGGGPAGPVSDGATAEDTQAFLEGVRRDWTRGVPDDLVRMALDNLADFHKIAVNRTRWEPMSIENGVAISRVPTAGKMPAIIVAQCLIRRPLPAVKAYITDTSVRKNWDKQLEWAEDKVLYNEDAKIVHSKFFGRFFVAPRDFVTFGFVSRSPAGDVWIDAYSVPETAAEHQEHLPGVVRAHLYHAAYRLVQGDQGTVVTYVTQADKINIPAWIDELTSKWTALSIADIRREIE